MADITVPQRYRIAETLRDDDAEFLARAEDTVLHREVLLKAPGPAMRRHLAATEDATRVMREARALAKIRHPGIIRLLEIIECPGGPLLVLEPIAGENLADRVARSGPLPAEEIARIGRDLASALAAVHSAGAVHRGIAPENVVLDARGAPVLVSFGFAKFIASSGIASSIQYGTGEESRAPESSLPLPRYPAPEQLLGQPADARTDLFALGATLRFALTGSDSQPERKARKTAPAQVEQAIARCLSRSPLQRFQNATELEAALSQPAVAAAPARRELPLRRIGAGLAAAAAIVVVGLRFGAVFQSGDDAGGPGSERGSRVADFPATTPTEGAYAPRYATSHALLIGIGDVYADRGYAPLKNAQTDVAALRAQLESMPWEKWQVRQLVGAEASKQRMLDELSSLITTAPDDRVLVYFAGHGERDPDDAKSGWLIPADGEQRRTARDEHSWISYDELNGMIRRMKAKHVLLMLDCCFSGVMTQFRSPEAARFGQLMLKEKAHLVLASGRPNERVPDGEGKHSPFLDAFLDALSTDAETLTASGLFARIQESAPRNGGAIPMFAPLEDGGAGDVVFFLRAPK